MSGNCKEISLGWLKRSIANAPRVIGDYCSVVPSKVMWLNQCISTLAGDIGRNRLESLEICGIKCTSHASCRGDESLHEESNTEGFHSLAC